MPEELQHQGSTAPSGERRRSCNDTDRRIPEQWWSCIEALNAAGETDVAARERQLLRAAFPQFEATLSQ